MLLLTMPIGAFVKRWNLCKAYHDHHHHHFHVHYHHLFMSTIPRNGREWMGGGRGQKAQEIWLAATLAADDWSVVLICVTFRRSSLLDLRISGPQLQGNNTITTCIIPLSLSLSSPLLPIYFSLSFAKPSTQYRKYVSNVKTTTFVVCISNSVTNIEIWLANKL